MTHEGAGREDQAGQDVLEGDGVEQVGEHGAGQEVLGGGDEYGHDDVHHHRSAGAAARGHSVMRPWWAGCHLFWAQTNTKLNRNAKTKGKLAQPHCQPATSLWSHAMGDMYRRPLVLAKPKKGWEASHELVDGS